MRKPIADRLYRTSDCVDHGGRIHCQLTFQDRILEDKRFLDHRFLKGWYVLTERPGLQRCCISIRSPHLEAGLPIRRSLNGH